MGWVGGRFKSEGTYAYLWLIHTVIGQKPTQHCKTIILQLKINVKKTEENPTDMTVYAQPISNRIEILILERKAGCWYHLVWFPAPHKIIAHLKN